MFRKKPVVAASLLIPVALLLSLTSCGKLDDGWKGSPRGAWCSFPPLYCFARNVGGDGPDIQCLCKDIGPHDYRFNIQDSVRLRRADLFLANGLGLDDHFTDRMSANSGNSKLVYRKVGDNLDKGMRRKSADDDDHDHAHSGHEHHHHHGPYDPHFWLGIDETIAVVEQIRDALKDVEPRKATDYEKNAAAYIDRLKALKTKGKAMFVGKKPAIITFHESMGYFAKSFDLNAIGHLQPAPGIDPSSSNFVELLKTAKPYTNIIITVEPQYPRTAAETLKKRLEQDRKKVTLVEIDPLETYNPQEEDLTADWYERKMLQNLEALAKAMQ